MKPLPCPPHRWNDFSRLLDEALALPPAERSAWLGRLSDADAELREPLAKVLASAEAQPDPAFLQAPHLPPAPEDEPLRAGVRIGPYALISELGRGGMGVVWLARRADGAYEREVALKLPHAHLLSGSLRERFLQERDILASLSHPHIARFYDAGLAADGQPYLALERVQGRPITDWVRERRLGLDARLALFAQVLGAVAHAHGKLVAHRDLKPANVLVDDEGQVRLLDFGIAKLLDGQDAGTPAEALTRAGHRPATPGYAAPEQLVGGPITVATDVYALGLMLFELLCGQAPPQVESARRGQAPMPADWQAELPRPSASVDAAAAAQMGLSLRAAQRALAGDLDAIVAQATRTDPRERYDSVAQLAADLGRHGRGQPIRARRITAWQRAAKFVRRHRSATALSALLFFSLVAGISGVLWQAHQAQAQARRAEAVKQFLLGVFKASDPRMASDTPRGQITAKALLDASAGQIEAHFSGDPELQIELLRTAADIYRELGEDEAYDRYQARQIALARQHFGPLHENVLEGMVEAAVQAFEQGDSAACRRLLDEVDPLLRQAGQDDSELRGTWWSQRAVCLRELPDAAADREVALQQSLRLFEKHAPLSRGHVTAWAELATERTNAGRFADGVAAQREVIALAQRVPDRNEAELQTLYSNLGVALLQLGDLAGAEQAFAQSAEIAQRTSGAASRKAWVPAGKRARTAHLAGQRERAQQWFAEVIAVLPPGDLADADALMVREDYGERLAAEGRPLAAIPWLEGVERQWRTSAPQDFALRRVRRSLGDAYDRAGRSGDARRVLNQALVDYEAHSPASSQTVIAMRERWGRFLLDQGEAAAARAQFEQAVRDAATPTWSHVALAQAGLARLALAAGDMDQARTQSAQALKTWDALTGFRDVRMAPYLWRVRAAVLARSGDSAAAAALRQQALEASQRYDDPQSPTVRDPGWLGL